MFYRRDEFFGVLLPLGSFVHVVFDVSALPADLLLLRLVFFLGGWRLGSRCDGSAFFHWGGDPLGSVLFNALGR